MSWVPTNVHLSRLRGLSGFSDTGLIGLSAAQSAIFVDFILQFSAFQRPSPELASELVDNAHEPG